MPKSHTRSSIAHNALYPLLVLPSLTVGRAIFAIAFMSIRTSIRALQGVFNDPAAFRAHDVVATAGIAVVSATIDASDSLHGGSVFASSVHIYPILFAHVAHFPLHMIRDAPIASTTQYDPLC